MNYPLISEYVEAIMAAYDNFKELTHLRPVLDANGQPVMTSGGFAVVFKMKDEQTGRLHAVKCFLKEQEGRAEAYRLIAEELEYVSSTFLTPIRYLDKELFVDTSQTDETEFPVLLMDWVEGTTLDKYIREHIDDDYELSLLAYQFSRLAMWLMPQPFAHGDLKPDNILVREDGTLALVDYDGMYVPAMKGQKARELGSPDFRHPSRTETDFDEHIDDFSLASILLSLKAISLHPELLEEYGASDRLLFSEKDYRNLSESRALDALKSLMQDAELASLYSLFILAASQNNLSLISFRLFNLSRPERPQNEEDNLSTEVTEGDLANAWIDEFGVKYSTDKKRLLRIPDDIIDYRIRKGTQVICDEAFGKIGDIGITGNNNLKLLYIPSSVEVISNFLLGGEELDQIIVDNKNPIFDSRDNCNAIIRTKDNNLLLGCKSTKIPEDISIISEHAFLSCIGLKSLFIPNSVKVIGRWAFMNCYHLTQLRLPDSITRIEESVFSNCWELKNIFLPPSLTYIGARAFSGCITLTDIIIPINVESIGYGAFTGCTALKSITIPDAVTRFEKKKGFISSVDHLFYGCSNLTSIIIPKGKRKKFEELLPEYKDKLIEQEDDENLSTEVTDEDLANAWTDEFGVKYSKDKKRLLRIPDDIIDYRIRKGTQVICDDALKMVFRGEQIKNHIKSLYIPESVKIISSETSVLAVFPDLCQIVVDEKNITFDSRNQCNAIIKTQTNELLFGCQTTVIPKNISIIASRAFFGCKGLTSIAIPKSVTRIENLAFAFCRNLTSITIPEGVTSIGNLAFFDCIGLTSITIPDSVTYIGKRALCGCGNLTTIFISKGTKTKFEELLPEYKDKLIEQEDDENLSTEVTDDDLANAWTDEFGVKHSADRKRLLKAPNIKWYEIKQGTRVICDSAFECNESLTNIIIPEGVKVIGKGAFSECYYLTNINIPNSITKIEEEAFLECDGLTSILIPKSVTSIEKRAFEGCSGLTSISIPNSVTCIGDWAFEGCSELTNIIIPDSVMNIGEGAFSGCRNLISIIVDKHNVTYDSRNSSNAIVETLSNTLIKGCNNTIIPDSVISIGDSAFSGCSGLTSIKIPDSVTSIREHAFAGCSSLQCIIIPKSVTSIGDSAFSGCSGLTSIKIPDSVTSIGNRAFEGCSGLTSIDIPKSVTSIGSLAFCGCCSLQNIVIPDSVTEIRNGAFSGCRNLTNIIIPNSVTCIGDHAFTGCTGLTRINIPDSVTSIGDWAFDGCSSLQSIVIPDSVTEIGGGVFSGCSNLTNINLPKGMTNIGKWTFYKCIGLISISIPNSVTSIGENAFCGCSRLTNIIIPDSVTSIGDNAFEGCSGLTSIDIPKSVTSIGDNAFKGCSGVTPIIIPKGTKTKFEKLLPETKAIFVKSDK